MKGTATWWSSLFVIASGAKQSRGHKEQLDCFVGLAPRNDGEVIRALSRAPTKTRPATVKHATLDLLRAFGIDKVFGNPGSTELPFLSDWPDDIDYVLGLQEASVVGMADGYAQATRNAGFVNLHSAAGVGNALGNIYTAHRNQTPLVITAGQQARSILPLQAFLYAERASEFPRPYVKYQRRAGARRGRARRDRAGLLRGDAAALRPDIRIGADRRLDASGAAAASARSQPRIGAGSRGDEGAGRGAVSQQATRPRGRPRASTARSRRSDGACRREGKSRGVGQPVFGALQFSRAASAIRRFPACLAGATFRGAARA